MEKKNSFKLDRHIFIISLIVLVAISAVIFLFPQQSTEYTQRIFSAVMTNLGFLFTWAGVIVIAACMYFAFSRYGKIKMGDPDEKPEFKTLTWGAILFTSGIAAALMFWGAIEWFYYYTAPPFNIVPQSWEAAEWAGTYGIFHWGITAWSFYAICALPVGYCYFVKKTPILKISEVCRGVLGDKVDGMLGKTIDIVFIISLVCGAATSLGVGVPMVSAAICSLIGIPEGTLINVLVLIGTTLTFGVTGFLGLKKGIAKLSDLNIVLSFIILLIVFIGGPTLFIIKMSTTSIGLLASNFIRMSTWMDPVSGTRFPEQWTQFYWAWFMAYAPFMGLFIARISRGRTVRNILLGTIAFGGLGCSSFFLILGNYQMNLQLTGQMDFVTVIAEHGASYAIMEGFKKLPLGTLVIFTYAICGIVFLATTFNSVSFTLAAVTTQEIKADAEPNRFLILFWAFILGLLPLSLLLLDGPFSTLQSVTSIGSIPIIFVIVIEIISFVRDVKGLPPLVKKKNKMK